MKLRENCYYDEVSIGEVMLRFDPGDTRIRCARSFHVYEGGGEYNVARGLRKCFNLKTAILTAFADNDIGRLAEELICQGGVDTGWIQWLPFDGIGHRTRNGLNFTERGFGVRSALGISDRGHTAASQMKPLDFERLFGELGVRWLHTGGIYAALSDQSAETLLAAVKTAKKYGTIVSYDLNYRPSLWKDRGGLEAARRVNSEIAGWVDVMIGNEEDFTACLGLEIPGNDLQSLNIEGYERMIQDAVNKYPNFQVVATTLREVHSASINNWGALCWMDGTLYRSKEYKNLEIFDRVGGGDSFASGLIYGLMELKDPQLAVDFGAAHGALAMTTPGDTSMASLKEVQALVQGKSARVQR